MKKTLIVITKGEIGGAQIFVLNLAKELKANGVDVCVGFGYGAFLKNELKRASIPYTRFKWLKRTHNPFANLFFINEIKKFIDKNPREAIHFNSSNALFGAIGAKLSRTKPKTIFTFHGLSVLDKNYKTLLKPIYKLMFKFLLSFVDKAVFVSKYNLKTALSAKVIKNGEVIHNGLNPKELNFFQPQEAKRFLEDKININLQKKFLIGSIGRLVYAKNYEFLINAFPDILKINKDAVGLIIGEGDERKKYEKIIKQLNLQNKIFLIGEIKNAHRYLRGFDLFVLPSRYEGLSMTLIEALFAGTPILAADVGGNSEILSGSDEQARRLYKLNDKNDFLNAITPLIRGTRGVKFYQEDATATNKFLLGKTAENYLKLYNGN